MINEWCGVLHTLVGFENHTESGKGTCINFILSNGARSQQTDKDFPTKYTHMMTAEVQKMIKSVDIWHDGAIYGF